MITATDSLKKMLIKAFLILCLLAGFIHGLTESNPGTDNEFEACWEKIVPVLCRGAAKLPTCAQSQSFFTNKTSWQ